MVKRDLKGQKKSTDEALGKTVTDVKRIYCLASDAEVPATLVVLREELTRRTEAADLLHGRGRRVSACAEELVGLVFFQAVVLVVLAYFAVLPADLPVLFSIRYTVLALIQHALFRCAIMDNTFF
jgi:hypothetical protein